MEIEPEQLSFRRPFTVDVVKCPLTLKNKSSNPIAFKIKTTAPKTYCVRPNAGLILPNETKTIGVLLQPMESDPAADYKCKDKFLVLGLPVKQAAVDFVNANATSDVWQVAEENKAGEAIEKKLRVVFLPALDASSTGAAVTVNGGVGSSESPTNSLSKQVSEIESPSARTSSVSAASAGRNDNIDRLLQEGASGGKLLNKLEQTLKDKDDEIKRLQKLCMQYKNQGSGSSVSIVLIILVAVAAFVIGQWLK